MAIRITPACAGKSYHDNKIGNIDEDHPCVCREKLKKAEKAIATPGSPLRVQGKGLYIGQCFTQDRITPACAGKSDHDMRNYCTTQDHPCVCREKIYLI